MTAEKQVAIITGAASGIGRALAEELARTGVSVVLADRQAGLAEQVAAGIRATGGAATCAELDVRDPAGFREVVRATVRNLGRLDYLFNNAGIGITCDLRDCQLEDWNDVIDVNLRGVVHGVLAAYPLMIQQGFGHIVNTASMAGLNPWPLLGAYTTTKWAVVGLSRALRIEARRYGVNVTVLCPGGIRTPLLHGGLYGRWKLKVDPAVLVQYMERLRPMDPSLFAGRVVRALKRNPAILIEPKWWRVFWYLDRFSPRLCAKIWDLALRWMDRELRLAQGA